MPRPGAGGSHLTTRRYKPAYLPAGRVEALVYNEQTAGPQAERVKKAAEGNRISMVSVAEPSAWTTSAG